MDYTFAYPSSKISRTLKNEAKAARVLGKILVADLPTHGTSDGTVDGFVAQERTPTTARIMNEDRVTEPATCSMMESILAYERKNEYCIKR